MAGNLLSYIIQERTGKTPEEYALEKVFPFLGIEENDYEWYRNLDQVQTSFHGLKMTSVALTKLGMLYLQNGMASDDEQIVDPSWIERSFTLGDKTASDKFGYIGWWLDAKPAFVTYGFGGQRLALNPETHRVVAILSDTYYKDAGLDTYKDPTALFPTDQIKEKFAYETPSTPIKMNGNEEPAVCETMTTGVVDGTGAPPQGEDLVDSSGETDVAPQSQDSEDSSGETSQDSEDSSDETMDNTGVGDGTDVAPQSQDPVDVTPQSQELVDSSGSSLHYTSNLLVLALAVASIV
eukprot:186939_1